MNIEIQRNGEAVNLAWTEPTSSKSATLFVDSEEAWLARRKLVRSKLRKCYGLHFAATEPHEITEFASALELVQSWNIDELSVVGCNATALPCAALGSQMFPTSLLLVNPKPCLHVEKYWQFLKKSQAYLRDIPNIKIMHRNDPFGSELGSVIRGICPHSSIIELDGWSSTTMKVVRTEGYLQSQFG